MRHRQRTGPLLRVLWGLLFSSRGQCVIKSRLLPPKLLGEHLESNTGDVGLDGEVIHLIQPQEISVFSNLLSLQATIFTIKSAQVIIHTKATYRTAAIDAPICPQLDDTVNASLSVRDR